MTPPRSHQIDNADQLWQTLHEEISFHCHLHCLGFFIRFDWGSNLQHCLRKKSYLLDAQGKVSK
jgi:hypothetical protein